MLVVTGTKDRRILELISEEVNRQSDPLKNLRICAEIVLKTTWKPSGVVSSGRSRRLDQNGTRIPNIAEFGMRGHAPLVRHHSIRINPVRTGTQIIEGISGGQTYEKARPEVKALPTNELMLDINEHVPKTTGYA